MSLIGFSHHKYPPGGHKILCILKKLPWDGDCAEDVRTEEAAKLAQRWEIASITKDKLNFASILGREGGMENGCKTAKHHQSSLPRKP